MSTAAPIERRAISIEFEDGARLELSAERPPNAEGHGEERLSATLREPDAEAVEVDDVRLSTEYDAEGRQRRATLEVWVTQEGPPLRGAGRALKTSANGASDAVPFEWSLEGRAGAGPYELVRGHGS